MKKLLSTFTILLSFAAFALAAPTADNPFAGVHDPSSGSFFTDTIAYWHLDGTTIDETNDNNGTPNGGVAITEEGRVGKAYEFDGSDDFINISGFTSTSKTYSFTMWAKSNATGDTTNRYLFDSQSDRFVLEWFTDTAGKIGYFDGSDVSITDTPVDGNWHHLAYVFDNGAATGTLYIDGTSAGSGSYTGRDIGGSVIIGAGFTGVSANFNGTIDEFHIWNRSLNSTEISQLYNMSKGDFALNVSDLGAAANESTGTKNIYNWYVNDTSIVLLNLPFDHNNSAGTGKTKDYSSYGNNGTEQGQVTWCSGCGLGGSGAYQHDGGPDDDDFVNVTDIGGNGSNPLSISIWFFPQQQSIEGTAFHLGSPNLGVPRVWTDLRVNLDKTLRMIHANNDFNLGASIEFDEWQYFAWTYNGSYEQSYLNGVLIDSRDFAWAATRIDFWTGMQGNQDLELNGTVDEVLVFNRSLTSAQIQALYQNKTSFIANEETTSCETWKADVTPNNGTEDGTTKTTAEIPIEYFYGNSLVECAEQCDTNNLSGQTCQGLGHTGGILACSAPGTFDESGCTDAAIIPEFSTIGLILTLITIGLASVLIIRKKRQ